MDDTDKERLARLETSVEVIKGDIHEIKETQQELKTTLDKWSGVKTALIWIAGLSLPAAVAGWWHKLWNG